MDRKKKPIFQTLPAYVDIEGEVGDVIQSLTKIQSDYPGWDSVKLEIENGYDGEFSINVIGSRVETDEEYDKRLATSEKWETKKAALERAEYLRLKKKFGD